MADYFTNFSVTLELPHEAAQSYALALAEAGSEAWLSGDPDPHFPEPLVAVVDDWIFEIEAEPASTGDRGGGDATEVKRVWPIRLHSSSGGIDAACEFIRHLLGKFDPSGFIGFAWSYDCSKPLPDAFGGGAAFITADRIETVNTGEWLGERTAAHAANLIPESAVVTEGGVR